MQTQQKKLKILITTDLYTTNTNGVVTSVQNLFDELTARGHDVRILTISDTLHSHKEGPVTYIRSVSLEKVYPNVRMPVSFRHQLIQELIQWKPDVVHSQCEFFSYQFATRISRITGAPIVHTYHTLYEQYVTSYLVPSRRFSDALVKHLSRLRLKKASTIIAPTQKVENTLQGYGMTSPIEVVPSGISLEQHRQRLDPEIRLQKRRALGIGDEHQVLLNLGRLGGEKNLSELIELFAQAREENENLKFLIVGDGPAREELEALARKRNVSEHVIFTGMVPPSQVQEYYQLGDVFVSASTSETQGLTYIEAAANGLPLLCRQDECLTDVLQEGENGYEYTSAEEFLQAIDAVMEDPEWRENASRRSTQIADNFDKKAFADAIESIYESVLCENADRSAPSAGNEVTKMTNYKLLCAQLEALTQDIPHETANLANASALLWQTLKDINWAGFYKMEGGILVLGPFQGKPACIEIAVGKGVCGTAVAEDKTQLVYNVHDFPGHIACDSASNSEIVVPIHAGGTIWGVLDIDSPLVGRFTEEDRAGLEAFVKVLEQAL